MHVKATNSLIRVWCFRPWLGLNSLWSQCKVTAASRLYIVASYEIFLNSTGRHSWG